MYFDTLHGRDLALAEHGLDEGDRRAPMPRRKVPSQRYRRDDARRLCPRRGSSVLLHVSAVRAVVL